MVLKGLVSKLFKQQTYEITNVNWANPTVQNFTNSDLYIQGKQKISRSNPTENLLNSTEYQGSGAQIIFIEDPTYFMNKNAQEGQVKAKFHEVENKEAIGHQIEIISQIRQYRSLVDNLRRNISTKELQPPQMRNHELVEKYTRYKNFLLSNLKTARNYAAHRVVEFFEKERNGIEYSMSGDKAQTQKKLEELTKEFVERKTDRKELEEIITETTDALNIYMFGSTLLNSNEFKSLKEDKRNELEQRFYGVIPEVLKYLNDPRGWFGEMVSQAAKSQVSEDTSISNLDEQLTHFINTGYFQNAYLGSATNPKKPILIDEKDWKKLLKQFSESVLNKEYVDFSGSKEDLFSKFDDISKVEGQGKDALQVIYESLHGKKANHTFLNVFWQEWKSHVKDYGIVDLRTSKIDDVSRKFVEHIVEEYEFASKNSMNLLDLRELIEDPLKVIEYEHMIYQTTMTVMFGAVLDYHQNNPKTPNSKKTDYMSENPYHITNLLNVILHSSGIPLYHNMSGLMEEYEDSAANNYRLMLAQRAETMRALQNVYCSFPNSLFEETDVKIPKKTIDYIVANALSSKNNFLEELRIHIQNRFPLGEDNADESQKLIESVVFHEDISAFNVAHWIGGHSLNKLLSSGLLSRTKIPEDHFLKMASRTNADLMELDKKERKEFANAVLKARHNRLLMEVCGLASINQEWKSESKALQVIRNTNNETGLFSKTGNLPNACKMVELYGEQEKLEGVNATFPYARTGLVNTQVVDYLGRTDSFEDKLVRESMPDKPTLVGIVLSDESNIIARKKEEEIKWNQMKENGALEKLRAMNPGVSILPSYKIIEKMDEFNNPSVVYKLKSEAEKTSVGKRVKNFFENLKAKRELRKENQKTNRARDVKIDSKRMLLSQSNEQLLEDLSKDLD